MTGIRTPEGPAARLTPAEIRAGTAGQAPGLDQARPARQGRGRARRSRLPHTRPNSAAPWPALQADPAEADSRAHRQAGLAAGGLPCPPFCIGSRAA